MMFHRMLYNPITEYFIAGSGLGALFIAQTTDVIPSPFANIVSLGTVLGIVLWMMHTREQKQAEIADKREERLLRRIEVLEDGNDKTMMQLIERQMVCAAKTDGLLVRVEETLATFNQTIRKFSEGRPCLLEDCHDLEFKTQTTKIGTLGGKDSDERE